MLGIREQQPCEPIHTFKETEMFNLRKKRGHTTRMLRPHIFTPSPVVSSMLALALAGTAVAGGDWPNVIDQMPNDAQIVLCTRPLNRVNDDYSQFTAAIELAQLGFMPGPLDALAMVGLNTDAMNLDGSIGIAVLKNRWDNPAPPILAFVPVSNYDAWIGSFGAQAVADTKVSKINFGQAMGQEGSETWFVRPSGSFAVLGLDQSLVTGYKNGNGNIGKWQKIVGELGSGIVSRCDISAFVDFEGLTPLLKERINASFEEMDAAIGNLPPGVRGPGMDPESIKQMFNAYKGIATLVADEMRSAAAGLRFDANGTALDFSIQWKEGGKFASMFPGTKGKTTNVLNRFQDKPFMFAVNADTSGIKVDEFMQLLMDNLPEQMTMGMGNTASDMWKNVNGMGMVLYPSPAGIMMGGLFNGAAIIYTGEGKALRDNMMKMMTNLNGKELQGIKYTFTFDEAAKEIAGVPVDSWTMSMDAPPKMATQLQQSMMMMYGSAGPGGYIAQLDDGIVMTMSRNSKLLEAVINSARKNEGIGRNTAVRAVDGLLSPNPSSTFYIGIGAILEQIGPIAAMAMPGLKFDPETLGSIPPIAASMSIADGGIQGTLAIPSPTIKLGMKIYSDFQMANAMNNGNGGGEDDEPDIF